MGFIIYKYEARECWVQRVQLQPAADATNQDTLRCATRQWPVLGWKPPSGPESLLEIKGKPLCGTPQHIVQSFVGKTNFVGKKRKH
ncbi:hypothetical protein QG37_06824 [Candidozyma auris]|uniref:Uncharacterized protein n=1 Tax=Candidozyma auris TaxID=498019 RepID=A0A0L0NRB2_CANAR|nr:hypothetical protein QG37_06824 [[Candida] auris]